MPTKSKLSTTAKRRASSASPSSAKKSKTERTTSSADPLRIPHPFHRDAEESGIVLRQFYPPEMSNTRARSYNAGVLARPIEVLNTALANTTATRKRIDVKDAVVHWFKADLRTCDNRALYLAAQKARDAGVSLICLFIISPQDWVAHFTAPARVDFVLRTLALLQHDLSRLDIPLWVETVEQRKHVPGRIFELMEEWGSSHLFTNMEYEVDELRREARLVCLGAEKGIAVEVLHDTCVVPPGQLASGSGKQYAVYTPWFSSWVRHIHDNLDLIDLVDAPARNDQVARTRFGKLFDCEIPAVPENKRLPDDQLARYRSLWPAGEREAQKRLQKFCEERIGQYAANRNFPLQNGTSSLSVHLASGTLSARMTIRTARDRNKTKRLDGGSEGIQTWISEVAWRDFYKHVLVNWPYVCMNKPFKPEYSNIVWSYSKENFEAWTAGKTGFPIVDAAMRQLAHSGWMHNRCRMIVASFLAKDLLLDWRMGERWFMEHLIDGDFASNNGGWGFAASVGVDPQPYFRVFNPLLQSEKFDPEGGYIRNGFPNSEPYRAAQFTIRMAGGKGQVVKKAGYPEAIVEHKGARERALKAYKEGIAKDM